MPPNGTFYLTGLFDSNGDKLDGKATYKLNVPKDTPAKDFWSVIVYSMEKKAFIYSDLGRVGLSSYDVPSMSANDDGSVDIYFGKAAPEGLGSNWIPSAGKDFFILFRFYGPQEAVFDKSFVLPDVEVVN